MAEPTRSSGTEDTIPASDLVADPKPAPIAEERYKFGAELGRGGMGRVVEAYDTHLGRTVALKEVLPTGSANIAKRFQREVRITARLEHASIVPLYDSGVMKDGRPFYVMRRVTGRPLDELIGRAKNLEERLALLPNVLAAIDAVGHAHRRGVIHRDIKPANILVGDLGETVVIDWGLAKVVGEEEPPPESFEPFVPTAADSLKTQIGAVFGTPGFMAPEQARGDELDPRSDVYALGATLYQLLAGKPPVGGSSATEMIASTATKRVVPIRKVAPLAPPELATIIDKALSFEAEKRYADGSELAEDVRRFTTGQLVAAHRYTTRQRIARYVRRHRAALSVAALAATAVAVLAWVSVHRILKERDAARAARSEAEQARTVADTKAEEARQRADQLLLAHARGLVETNPTEAIATLKHLESTDPQTLDGARAIAKGAVARGVAWGVRSLPGATTSFEMTRDGKRLLQVNRDGQLQIVDVELRKQLATKDIGKGNIAMWVDGDRKILVDRSKQPPAIYDPATGALEPIGTVELKETEKTSDGKLVAFLDGDGHVGVIDVAARTITIVWNGSAERSLAIADNGSWLAFGDRIDKKRSRLVVVDRAGKQLLERPGTATVLAASPGGKLAASLYEEIVEARPADPNPVFTKIPLEPKEAMMIHQLVYRDEVMQLTGPRNVMTWVNGRVLRSDTIGDTTYFTQFAAGDVLVVTSSDSNVHLLRAGAQHVMRLTEPADGMYRVAAAPGGTRVAATTSAAILIWDTAALFPRIADGGAGMFVSNRRMLVPEAMMAQWYLWDVDTGARTNVKPNVDGFPTGFQVLLEESRALTLMQNEKGVAAVVIHGDGTSYVAVDDLGKKGSAVLVPGNALVYTLGRNRLFGKVGTEASRELVTLAGDLQSLSANGKLGYAALSTTGELVKGTFGGAEFARTQLPDLDKNAFIIGDGHGSIFIGAGNRLLSWRGDVHEVARFAVAIDFISVCELGLYIELENRDVFFVPATGNQTPQRVPLSSLSSISHDGRVVAGLSPSSQVELADMPSLAPWSLPRLVSTSKVLVSPDGQRVVQPLVRQVAIWRIAQPGSDFSAWLAELTNATEDEGHVRWPWQP